MLSRVIAHTLIVLVATSLTATSAFGQTFQQRSARAYQGLFGYDQGRPLRPENARLTFSLYGGYDQNLVGTPGLLPLTVDPQFRRSGGYGGGDGQVAYTKQGRRVDFGAALFSTARYYPRLHDAVARKHALRLGLDVEVGPRTSLYLSELAQYRSFFTLGSFASLTAKGFDDVLAAEEDIALVSGKNFRTDTNAGLKQQLTRRTAMTVGYGYSRTDYREDLFDLVSQSGAVTFSIEASRYASVILGYRYAEWKPSVSRRKTHSHDVHAGVDYGAPLRRGTYFTIGTSSQAVRLQQNRSDQFRINGHALLLQNVGRTWQAELGYRRGMRFVEGLPDPFFYDSVNAGLSGFLDRRTDVIIFASYSFGDLSLLDSRRSYDLFQGSARLRYALTRNWAVFSQYSYYRYQFDEEALLPPGVARNLNRNAIRIGVMAWLPLIH